MTALRRPVLLLLSLLLAVACREDAKPGNLRTARVRRGALNVQTVLDGTLETRRIEKVNCQFAGGAVLTELVPEGATVHRGDVVARFDDAQARRDFLRLQRDLELAKADFETLRDSTLPLELDKAVALVDEARAEHGTEQRYLDDCRELARDGLMNAKEIEQIAARVARLAAKSALLEREYASLRGVVASSRLARARATFQAAEQELGLARGQLDSCVVTAPGDGVVVYLPLHVGSEFRVARVGDTVLKNQPFLSIPDPREWIAVCSVPELEVDRVAAGAQVVLSPLALPGVLFTGRVESVGAMAQELPGKSGWAKAFRVVIAIGADAAGLTRARSGLSIDARVTTAARPDALLVPRAALEWDGQGRVWAATPHGPVQVSTGLASDSEVEVLAGLKEGDEVLLP